MSDDHGTFGPGDWMRRLEDGRLRSALEKAGRLPAEERRRLLSNPAVFLEREGLSPPPGIEVRFLDQQFDPEGFPELPRLPEFPDLPHLFWLCIQVCDLIPWQDGEIIVGLKRECHWVCIKV